MSFLIKVYIVIFSLIYRIFKFRKNQGAVIFLSRQSNEVPIDFLLIKEEIIKRDNKKKVFFSCKKFDNSAKGMVGYIPMLVKQLWLLPICEVAFLDSYSFPISVFTHKKDLKVVQLWHALGILKKVGYESIGLKDGRDYKLSKNMKMHKNYDYILASSENCVPAVKKVFGYDENGVWNDKQIKCIISPLPRTKFLLDTNFQESVKSKVRAKYDTTINKRQVILYTPTSRSDDETLLEKTNELIKSIDFTKYVLIISPHHLSKINEKIEPTSNIIVDSSFSSIEFCSVADYVITDYSAILFELMLLKKKIFLYTYDFETYEKERGFLIDFKFRTTFFNEPADIIQSLNDSYDFSWQESFLKKYIDLGANQNFEKQITDSISSS